MNEEKELVVVDDEELENAAVENEEIEQVEDVNTDEVNNTQNTEKSKTYTQKELDKILEARTNSINRKHQKELQKYRSIENTLKKGMNIDNIDDISKQLREFYEQSGIEIGNDVEDRDEREERILAEADAREVISLGENEMKRRANELANIKRTAREEQEFMIICNTLVNEEAKRELKQKGVDESIIDSQDFKDFASQFNTNTKMSDIYEMYSKIKGMKKKQPKIIPGMSNNASTMNAVKEFYTKEEASKFSVKDFDNNPALFKAVEKSAEKWK